MAQTTVTDPDKKAKKKTYKIPELKDKLKAGSKRRYYFKIVDFKW